MKNRNIYIFKTSISSSKIAEQIGRILKQQLNIYRLRFDLEDCDNILKVESKDKIKDKVIRLLMKNGFVCEELL